MEVFETVFPIVAIAVFGYGLRRHEILSEPETLALERFTFYFLIPFLLFQGTATAELPEDMDWGFLLGFYLGVALLYLAGALLGRLLYAYDPARQSVFGMGAAYSNVTIVGIPVCLELLGERAFLPLFILIAVHNLFLFAFGTLLAERAAKKGTEGLNFVHSGQNLIPPSPFLLRLVLNPITGSLLAGLLVNLLGIPLYGPLMEAVGLLGRAAVPAALFVLGAALTRYRVRGEIGPALVMVGLKLLALPALIWVLMFQVFSVEPLWGATAVLLSAMPVGISVYVFARRYACCETPAAAAIVLSSVLSVLSISFWSWWLGTSSL